MSEQSISRIADRLKGLVQGERARWATARALELARLMGCGDDVAATALSVILPDDFRRIASTLQIVELPEKLDASNAFMLLGCRSSQPEIDALLHDLNSEVMASEAGGDTRQGS